MEIPTTIIFTLLLALGFLYSLLSYLEYRIANIDELKKFLKSKFISVSIFVAGILVHTLGDLSDLEMELETTGHFIIMVGAIILIKGALDLTKIAEEYGYD